MEVEKGHYLNMMGEEFFSPKNVMSRSHPCRARSGFFLFEIVFCSLGYSYIGSIFVYSLATFQFQTVAIVINSHSYT